MSYLILIRHSITNQQPDVDSHKWQLSEAGRQRCIMLADQLGSYSINQVITSEEPKAHLTGKLLAERLNVPCSTAPNLQETARSTVPYFEKPEDFKNAVNTAMKNPEELLFGEETFQSARERFSQQIERLLNDNPDQTLAVVTHGTVLSLYLAHLTGRDAYTFWDVLEMPAYAVLTVPDKILKLFVPDLSAT